MPNEEEKEGIIKEVLRPDGKISWRLVTQNYAVPRIEALVRKVGPISLRTLHYNLYSTKIIPNTPNAYHKLSRHLVDARKNGLVSWEHIVDETRRSYADFSDFYISPSDYVDDLFGQLGIGFEVNK